MESDNEDGVSKPKRSRSHNFSTKETERLITLVEKYKTIIECKTTDLYSWEDKNQAWVHLADEYNANSTSEYRSIGNLKRKFNNLKRVTRKAVGSEKNRLFKTGGGAYKPKPEGPHQERVLDIIRLSAEGLPDRFDSNQRVGTSERDYQLSGSDNSLSPGAGKDNGGEASGEEIESVFDIEDLVLDVVDQWSGSGYTPSMLRAPKHPLLDVGAERGLIVASRSIENDSPTPTTSFFSIPSSRPKPRKNNAPPVKTTPVPPATITSSSCEKQPAREVIPLKRVQLHDPRRVIAKKHGKKIASQQASTGENFETLAATKREYVELQHQILQQDQATRLFREKEEHGKKINVLDLQAELLKEQIRGQQLDNELKEQQLNKIVNN